MDRHVGRRILHRLLLRTAIIEPGEPWCRSPGSQAGIVTSMRTARRRSSRSRRSAPRGDRRRQRRGGGGFQGVDRARITTLRMWWASTPRRWCSPACLCRGARDLTPTCPGIHTADPCTRCGSVRSPAPVVRRDAGDVGHRRPRAAVGDPSSSCGTTACRSTCGRASPGSCTWAQEEEVDGKATHHLGRHPLDVRSEGHDLLGADLPGIAAFFLAPSLTPNVNVDMIEQNVSTDGHTDISFTVPKEGLLAWSTWSTRWSLRSKRRRQLRRHDRPGVAHWRRHEDEPGVVAQMFETLAAENVNIETISMSTIRISSCTRTMFERLSVRLDDAFEARSADRGPTGVHH